MKEMLKLPIGGDFASVHIAYARWQQPGPTAAPIVLIHGWSGSHRCFDLNAPELSAAGHTVLAVDNRFHGGSSSPDWGCHVHRLAADLREVLDHEDVQDCTVVGTSLGCAVIWAYYELFGPHRLGKAVFVDQAPLQNRAPGWECGSNGCYDAATLASFQAMVREGMEGVARGNLEFCSNLPIPEALLEVLEAETKRCDPEAMCKLMADHTQLDWRPILPHFRIPCLNLVGESSGVFPLKGLLAVGEAIPDCSTRVFRGANHWLYMERPDTFNRLLLAFHTGDGDALGAERTASV